MIVTNPRDADSFLVEAALQSKGLQVELMHLSDFPSRLTASLRIDPATSPTVRLRLSSTAIRDSGRMPKTIWWRRPKRPVVPPDVHPEDREFVAQETAKFLAGLWYHLPATTVFVNHPASAAVANQKAIQLGMAQEVGFAIPPTLFSNDPAEIRSAIRDWGGKAIYKSYGGDHCFWWDADRGKLLALFTTVVDESKLPDDETLTLTPGIYQPLLRKDHELRLTVFGRTIFGVRILSQEQERSLVDWRNGQRTLRYEVAEVPPELADRCFDLLRRLGLLVGSFDLIVTPEKEVYFLEVNEGGQFLWLEDVAGLPVLDAFSDFLQAPSSEFSWKSPAAGISLADAKPAAAKAMALARSRNAMPEPPAFLRALLAPSTGEDG